MIEAGIQENDLVVVKKKADVRDGDIVEQGSHEELLKTCPAYLETYRIQMGDLA